VMSQYYVTHKVERQGDEMFPLINRRIRPREYEKVLEWVEELGFENGWLQPLESSAAEYYRPDFTNTEKPFADARDFR